MLEKNEQCGGGVVSIEIAPGFIHDPHASGYYTCVSSPVIQADELGLMKHGQAFADAIWEDFKSYCANMDDSKIIARHIETPPDHHHHSNSMMRGDIFGIGTTSGQLMGRRPIAELAQFKVPGLDALYLVGCAQHPGGTVTFGGRATAMKMMMDWKMELKRAFAVL